MSRDKEAREIINKFATSHARTAFIAGQLGGQFGLDRIPLTALTIAMIICLCDLYGVRDTQAKTIHIGWAIGRLTVRGTVLAQMILNWIPIAGPLANSAVTYFLTKQAGLDCVAGIKRKRMTVDHQTKKAIRQGVTTFAGGIIAEGAHVLGGDVIEGMVEDAHLLLAGTEILSDTLATFDEFLTNESLTEAGKVFVANVIAGLSKDIIENKPLALRERLLNAAMLGIAAGVFSEELAEHPLELSPERREHLQQLIATREKSPGAFRIFLDHRINGLVNLGTRETRHAMLRELVEAIDDNVEMVREGTRGHIQPRETFVSKPKRILVFGTVGAGKTSLCNAVTDEQDPQPVSNSAKGVTFESYTYAPFEVAGSTYIFTDTVGLNESDRGTVPKKEALKALVALLKNSDEGYNLLIHVMRIPRITKPEQDNYEFFVQTIADSRIPTILVATGCENIDPMSEWAEQNASVFEDMKMEYSGIVCTCFAKGGRFEEQYNSLRAQSASAVHAAIDTYASEEPIRIYDADAGFIQALKRSWNWFCKWVGLSAWSVGINEQIRVFLERLGFSSGEAKELATNWQRPEK